MAYTCTSSETLFRFVPYTSYHSITVCYQASLQTDFCAMSKGWYWKWNRQLLKFGIHSTQDFLTLYQELIVVVIN